MAAVRATNIRLKTSRGGNSSRDGIKKGSKRKKSTKITQLKGRVGWFRVQIQKPKLEVSKIGNLMDLAYYPYFACVEIDFEHT